MAEPTDAERTHVWDLVEWLHDETVKPEVDWPTVSRRAHELAAHIDAFLGCPGS